MILIADSGSTKTSWALLTRSGQCSVYTTDGINPFFQTEDEIAHTLSNQLLPQLAKHLWIGPITDIFFYGAGCTPEKSPVVKEAIMRVFRKCERTEVESDMLGAARALFGKEKGIACILGTGSNSSCWDGQKFQKSVPALGFILGDEGSGAVLGKRLVADILKNQLGDDLKQEFLTSYNTNQAQIIDSVYRQPFPNRYLAQFAKFAAQKQDKPQIRALLYDHFDQFVKRNLLQYDRLPVGFVGSIAFYFSQILEEVMQQNGLEIKQILQQPIDGLVSYHKTEYRNDCEC